MSLPGRRLIHDPILPMRSFLKFLKYAAIAATALVLFAVIAFFAVRTLRQNANAKAFAIADPKGIDEAGYVEIGGIRQWIQVRGHNRDNPILLCVHGGPGGTWIPVTRLFAGWERDFTVVLWDQRGAGKTLGATGPGIAATMSIERMTQDGIEVAEHLTKRFGRHKVVLLGHSFGSILGTRMALRRPELFHAFVGTGQATDLPRSMELGYRRLEDGAKARQDQDTLRGLAQIGPPPFKAPSQVAGYFQASEKYQPAADTAAMMELQRSLLSPPPNYSIGDELNRMKGFMSVPPWSLYQEMLGTRLAEAGLEFKLPVFYFQGTEDHVTPLSLLEAYAAAVRAPHKEVVRLDQGGHFAVWSHREAFHRELMQRVRPWVDRNP